MAIAGASRVVQRALPVLLVGGRGRLVGDGSQWMGLFVLVGVITALGLANPNEKDVYGIKLARGPGPGGYIS